MFMKAFVQYLRTNARREINFVQLTDIENLKCEYINNIIDASMLAVHKHLNSTNS